MDNELYQTILNAVKVGDTKTVQALTCLPDVYDSSALWLRMACNNGHAPCIPFLLPISSDRHFHTCLYLATQNNHTDCVRHILPHANPKHDHSVYLRKAVENNNQDIFDLLYPVSDPQQALQYIQDNYEIDYVEPLMIEQRLKADEEKIILQQSVAQGQNKIARKI